MKRHITTIVVAAISIAMFRALTLRVYASVWRPG